MGPDLAAQVRVRTLSAILLVLWGAACASADGAEGPEGKLVFGAEGKADNIAIDTLWPSARIPVCWESVDPERAEERGWVEDAVAGTWSAVSAVELVGWEACEPGAPGIHIGTTDWAPNTLGLGTEIDGMDAGMKLDFDFAQWSPGCQSTREFCIRAGAVHEVGHALGFAHEHGRSDTPGWCAREVGAFGGYSFTDWDADSIMNYCNPEWTGNGDLSKSDIIAVRALYGRDRGTVLLGRSDGDAVEPGWVLTEESALATLGPEGEVLLGDVTGDGRDDLVVADPRRGEWQMLESAGDRLLPARRFGSLEAGSTPLVADMDGDGRSDAVTVDASGQWKIALSDGDGFGESRYAGDMPAGQPFAADITGDGRADAVVVVVDRGEVWGAVSVGTGIAYPTAVASNLGAGADAYFVGDIDGDQRADFVAFDAAEGTWWGATTTEGGLSAVTQWTTGHGRFASARLLADVSGDGRADAVVYERSTGAWFSRSSDGETFTDEKVLVTYLGASLPRVEPRVRNGDVDGDGDSDVVLVW